MLVSFLTGISADVFRPVGIVVLHDSFLPVIVLVNPQEFFV